MTNSAIVSHRVGGNPKRFNNRRTRVKIAKNGVFDCHLSPIGRQMEIENLFLTIFDLRSSMVLTFSIAAYPVWVCCLENITE